MALPQPAFPALFFTIPNAPGPQVVFCLPGSSSLVSFQNISVLSVSQVPGGVPTSCSPWSLNILSLLLQVRQWATGPSDSQTGLAHQMHKQFVEEGMNNAWHDSCPFRLQLLAGLSLGHTSSQPGLILDSG